MLVIAPDNTVVAGIDGFDGWRPVADVIIADAARR